MIIEENKYFFSYSVAGSNKKIETISYEPKLCTVFSETGITWRFSSGQWKKGNVIGDLPNSKKYQNTYANLAVTLSLTN